MIRLKKSEMNKFLIRGIYFVIRKFISSLVTIRKKRVLLVQESYSGSNTYALSKLFSNSFKNKFDVILFKDGVENNFLQFIKKYILLASAKVILTTHASYKLKKQQVHFQLWHGPLIKKNGVMLSKKNNKFIVPKSWRKADFILSYSNTYTTLMNACMVTDPKKYVVLGAPRNDFLYIKNDRQVKNLIPEYHHYKRKVIIVPTMRFEEINTGDKSIIKKNTLYELFKNRKYSNFFLDKNTLNVIKPHPNDEAIIETIQDQFPSNIFVLTDKQLAKNKIDFYEILNVFDLLITDYSSIFYDFLLLNKPIIFFHNEEDDIKYQRDFLIESIADFLPGKQTQSIDELAKLVIQSFDEEKKDKYFQKRREMKNLIHRYQDNKSTSRIENFIENFL